MKNDEKSKFNQLIWLFIWAALGSNPFGLLWPSLVTLMTTPNRLLDDASWSCCHQAFCIWNLWVWNDNLHVNWLWSDDLHVIWACLPCEKMLSISSQEFSYFSLQYVRSWELRMILRMFLRCAFWPPFFIVLYYYSATVTTNRYCIPVLLCLMLCIFWHVAVYCLFLNGMYTVSCSSKVLSFTQYWTVRGPRLHLSVARLPSWMISSISLCSDVGTKIVL